jgi:hypothetical protein
MSDTQSTSRTQSLQWFTNDAVCRTLYFANIDGCTYTVEWAHEKGWEVRLGEQLIGRAVFSDGAKALAEDHWRRR